jgi:hypothetical protein
VKLERGVPPRDRRTYRKPIDTLEIDCPGGHVAPAAKIMSGGDAEASPRLSGQDPRELKTQEGIEHRQCLNSLSIATDRYLEKHLEGGWPWAGAPCSAQEQVHESLTPGRYVPSKGGEGWIAGKTPEVKSRTWL